MKLDKDTLVKNQFWFLLVVYLVIWVVALGVLKLGAADAVTAKQKAFEDNKKAIETAQKNRPKNKSFNEPWEKYGAVFAEAKNKVWQQAWETQNPSNRPDLWLFNWDWQTSRTARSLKPTLYVSDEIAIQDLEEYKSDLYKRQVDRTEIAKIAEPIELSPGVITQVEWTKTPTKEDFWYAQEDIWVKKEFLRVIRSVLDNVGRFEPVDVSKEPLPQSFAEKGIKTWRRFRNVNWEIDLALEPNPNRPSELQVSPVSTIKNVHPGKRTLALVNPKTNKGQGFKFRQNRTDYPFEIAGEPQPYGASPTKIGDKPVAPPGLNFSKEFELYQVFDWTSAPVKRIDQVVFPYTDQRLSDKPLKPHKDLPKPEEPAADASGGTPGMPGAPGGGPGPGGPGGPDPSRMGPRGGKLGGMGEGPGGPGGMGGMGAGDTGGDRTDNGLRRDRYLQTTETSRALPFGLVLIVDQSNIQDVLVALADSRLRVQTTQVAFQHVRGIRPSDTGEAGPAGGDRPGGMERPGGIGKPGMPPGLGTGGGRGGDDVRGPGPGGGGRKFSGMGGGPPGPGGKFGGMAPPGGIPPLGGYSGGFLGAPGMTGTTGQDEDDPNLVELSVYGIATLYERYPPKPADQTADPSKAAEKK